MYRLFVLSCVAFCGLGCSEKNEAQPIGRDVLLERVEKLERVMKNVKKTQNDDRERITTAAGRRNELTRSWQLDHLEDYHDNLDARNQK